MKNIFSIFIFSALLLGAHPSHSQEARPSRYPSSITSTTDVPTIVNQIMDVMGIKANFEVRAARIPNAAAVTYNGQRFILYNPDFIAAINKQTGTPWAGISILAHEIGHHLDGHTLSSGGSKPETELEADEFSGFVLRKMGAPLNDAQAAMRTAATARETTTHPAQNDRLIAIANGWNKAEAQLTGTAFTPQPIPRREVAAAAAPVSVNRSIIGQVTFNADASGYYFVTNKFNLVKYENNTLSVIGKLTALNSRRYPYVISDQETKLFVDAYGNIISEEGRKVGTLKARA